MGTIIKLKINNCSECPKVEVNRTTDAGFALDYFCSLTGDKVMGYVESLGDYKPVPKNCPLKIDK